MKRPAGARRRSPWGALAASVVWVGTVALVGRGSVVAAADPPAASGTAGASAVPAASGAAVASGAAAASGTAAASGAAAASGTAAASGAGGGENAASVREVARAAFARAETAARELRFADALAAYEEAATRDPTAPFAPTARVRAADLRAHSEGGFEPLAALEAVRRDPTKNRSREAIEDLERATRTFPEGRVRSEALLVVAQAYAHVFEDPTHAIAALEPVLADAHAERTTRTLALSELVAQHRQLGDLGGALTAVERAPDLLPTLTLEVRAEVRRVKLAKACAAALGALVLAALWGGVRGIRRLGDARKLAPLVLRPGALAFAFYLGAAGALFVRFQGGEGDPMPFLGLGLGVAFTSILVRLWSAGDSHVSRPRAALRASLGAFAVVAVAYLILWRASPDYLKPLGL